MIRPSQILWGSYNGYEGPYFPGTLKYVLPDNPTETEKRLMVVTSTEGGSYNAVNMYDVCIISIGLIQYCEGTYFLTSGLLHTVSESIGPESVRVPLAGVMKDVGCEWKKNAKGQWRFHFKDSRGEVDTVAKQRELFLGCDGKKGSWSPENKEMAKKWAAGMANIWLNQDACKVHASSVASRLISFVMPNAKKVLFDGVETEYANMFRAAYLSFTANNSVKADFHLSRISSKWPKWSREWCIAGLKELTFGPGIAIYPGRYDKLRPWLEKLWTGIDLPKNKEDLKNWVEPEFKEFEDEIDVKVEFDTDVAMPPIEIDIVRDSSDEIVVKERSFFEYIIQIIYKILGSFSGK